MNREVHVRICGRLGVKFPGPTRHHRVPGVSKPALMISLCAACHATVERLQVVRIWLPPQLLILWREQHLEAAYQLPLSLSFEPERAAGALVAVAFNRKIVELDV